MGAPEDPDYVPRLPPHTAPLAREPRWLGWYGVALCVPSCAVVAFGLSAFHVGVSENGALVAVVMLGLVAGFFGGLLLIGGKSKRAWLAAVLGGLALASIASSAVGMTGPMTLGRVMCEHGSSHDCSVLGRRALTREERAHYNEKACAGAGIRGACGRLARDESVERAQHALDGYCATRLTDYRCSSREVASFCGGGSTSEYGDTAGYSACDGDY